MSRPLGLVAWFLGPPASGKTTLSRELAQARRSAGRPVVMLDGDEVRQRLHRDLGFSSFDRLSNVTRVARLAKFLADQDVDVLVAMITPEREHQAAVRHIVPSVEFVYCHATLSALEARDPKGHYARARAGELRWFTGIEAPFEKPRPPYIEVQTERISIHAAIAHVINELKR